MDEDILEAVSEVGQMRTQLSPEQTLRTTALMLSIKYHVDTVIKDAAMYQQIKMDNKLTTPISEMQVIRTASAFERYIMAGLVEFSDDKVEVRIPTGRPEDPQSDV